MLLVIPVAPRRPKDFKEILANVKHKMMIWIKIWMSDGNI